MELVNKNEEFKNKMKIALDTANNNEEITKLKERVRCVADIEFEQLKKLQSIDPIRDDYFQSEINRTNSMANTSKIILQAVASEILINKEKPTTYMLK